MAGVGRTQPLQHPLHLPHQLGDPTTTWKGVQARQGPPRVLKRESHSPAPRAGPWPLVPCWTADSPTAPWQPTLGKTTMGESERLGEEEGCPGGCHIPVCTHSSHCTHISRHAHTLSTLCSHMHECLQPHTFTHTHTYRHHTRKQGPQRSPHAHQYTETQTHTNINAHKVLKTQESTPSTPNTHTTA